MTAEDAPEDRQLFLRLGFKNRHRAGNFDSSGYCNHIVAENTGGEIRLGCGVDCEAFHSASVNPELFWRIGQFSKAGIELAACGKTMKSQNVAGRFAAGLHCADRGGVERIAELQSQGYLCLRP